MKKRKAKNDHDCAKLYHSKNKKLPERRAPNNSISVDKTKELK